MGDQKTLNHEMVHWKQYQEMGLLAFYFQYFKQFITLGYDKMPMELEARYEEDEYTKKHYSEVYHHSNKNRVSNTIMRNISFSDAKKLLEKYVKDENVIRHSIAVSDFLCKISLKLKEKNPSLDINLGEMKVIGVLHDIGKIRKNELLHALTGSDILRREGLDKIATVIQTHSFMKEYAKLKNIKENFEPKTLEEKLLTYADLHIKGDTLVSFDERIKDLLKRSRENKDRYLAIKNGVPRTRKIINEIDHLLS